MSQWSDFCTMEFLVQLSVRDNAPQRVKIKVRNPIRTRDMLQQIERQLVELNGNLATKSPCLLPGSQLFIFSPQEDCFIPLEGKSANVLQNFCRLLVQQPVAQQPATSGGGTAVVRSASRTSCRSLSTSAPLETPQINDEACVDHGPQDRMSPDWKRVEDGDRRLRSVEPAENAITCKAPVLDEHKVESAMLTADTSTTIEVMLKVVGIILREHAARAAGCVMEPTEDAVWSIVEEVLYSNGNFAPCSLDPNIVDAFMQTIVQSISTR
uniref:Uncharacterized protein n=1 Tax=Trypanosoma congolense (strain IL3000) TaxID=1068625 RepID=G0UQ02_TRYCI|nr:conserved hypothetical protein [Trypanosoma congolense IL3000]